MKITFVRDSQHYPAREGITTNVKRLIGCATFIWQIREQAGISHPALCLPLSLEHSDFPRGLLLAPELEDAAFALGSAEISDVIASNLLGYHIVQVLEREERPIDAQNAELIRANYVRRWREQLWADASIERLIEP